MIKNIIPKIKKIFIGRHSELQQLEGLWDFSCEDKEHFVYVFLNAPGVGKTTLINYFGKSLESEGKGLFIKFTCSRSFDSPQNLNEEILFTLQETIRVKQELINKYIELTVNESESQVLKNNLKILNNRIEKALTKEKITLNDVIFVFKRLSSVIPIFFAADEIQEFQKLEFILSLNQEIDEKETALHHFTRILKDLMNSHIFLILSGTRYNILSQIGGKIGSPIRQKVEPIIIRNFEPKEVNDYVEQVKNLIKDINFKQGKDSISDLLENYRQFLFAFSGGHPRTIEKITNLFLQHIFNLAINSKYLDYDVFLGLFLPKIEEFFGNTLLSSVQKGALLSLSASEGFSEIKKWILNNGSHGLFLGERPKLNTNSQLDNELKRITYELINIGIIVQNGNYYYHLTSYFHFLEFLNAYHEPYEAFLRQVLHNNYFTLMCGRHSGFGYTFENILMATLIIHGFQDKEETSIHLQSSQLRTLKVIKGKLNWSELSLEPNIIYQTPLAEAIDAILLQNDEILIIQITTANPPNPLKIETLHAEMQVVSKSILKIKKVRGWFISLFDFKKEIPEYKDLLITASDQLIPILGEHLYKKLKEVKNSFHSHEN